MQLFREKISDKETKKAFQRMHQQVKEKGGELHFLMKIDDEGWFAQCKEFPGIITGGSNKNPTEKEIYLSVIDSLKTAFNVPITKLVEGKVKQYNKSLASVILERQFSLPNYAY